MLNLKQKSYIISIKEYEEMCVTACMRVRVRVCVCVCVYTTGDPVKQGVVVGCYTMGAFSSSDSST